MRCEYRWGSAFTLAFGAWALVFASAGLRATAGERSSDAAPSSGDIRVHDSSEAAKATTDAVPTPAKRKPAAGSDAIAPKAAARPDAAQPKGADKPAAAAPKPGEAPLRPIPESQEDAPVSVEAASFKGITPGATTREDVEKAWGRPKKTTQVGGATVHLYSVEPFRRVELNYADGKVSAIVIRLDRAFPAEAVARQLDLAAIRPVTVVDEAGETLGLAYPERGVLFAFEPSADAKSDAKSDPVSGPKKFSTKVSQIILEPISAESFVLRAETTLERRPDLSRRDLEQAITLEPSNARAHWLLGRSLANENQQDKATATFGKAVRLEPDNPQYRVTYAQSLAHAGRLPEAVKEAQKAVETGGSHPHLKAQALCLIGDLLASGEKPDFQKALTLHTQAIQAADPLTRDSNAVIRAAAKEVVVNAHLGAAHDIAWGQWKEKSKAVARWLERAAAIADDMAKNEEGGPELLFRVYARSLAAYVGLRGGIAPDEASRSVVAAGERLIASTRDPARKAQVQWELGMALYDAVQVCQMRSDAVGALKHGEDAVKYMAEAYAAGAPSASGALLGRLYFRLGTIRATNNHDHKAAVVWYDKALPLLDHPASEDAGANLGRQGESLVGMGVSYWETGRREKAVALTQKGITWMEQAVKQGELERSSLAIPYGNLAAMHKTLGAAEKAAHYQELAGRIREEKLK